MSFTQISRRILLIVILGFACVILLVWLNDYFSPTLRLGYTADTPEYAQAEAAGMFDASLDQGFWVEFGVEALLVIALAIVVLAGISQLLARIKYLEGFMLMCASCKKVRRGKEWMPLEEYLQHRSDVKISHSYCPECAAKIAQAPAKGVDR